MNEKQENSMQEIRDYFTKDPIYGRPFSEREFSTFWMSLTDEEKTEFKNADLTTK